MNIIIIIIRPMLIIIIIGVLSTHTKITTC